MRTPSVEGDKREEKGKTLGQGGSTIITRLETGYGFSLKVQILAHALRTITPSEPLVLSSLPSTS